MPDLDDDDDVGQGDGSNEGLDLPPNISRRNSANAAGSDRLLMKALSHIEGFYILYKEMADRTKEAEDRTMRKRQRQVLLEKIAALNL